MTTARAVMVIVALSLSCAGIVALASRTPPQIRAAAPGPDATDPSLGASFSDEQVSRHGRYRAPNYLAFALTVVLEILVLLVLARGPLARLVAVTERVPGGWPVRAALVAIALAVILAAVALPLGYVRGHAMQHAWGLSTQDVWGWLADRATGAGVAAITLAIAAVAFYGVVRWQPRTWWIWGWAAFTVLTALVTILWPVVIAPLFNRFTPIEDPALERRVRLLAAEAGVEIDRVLVADASRRTTTENAYVAGLGATKRMVLYDTLIAGGSEDETALVVAHELGHEVEAHVFKNVLIASAGLLAGFALLGWLAGRSEPWRWAGAAGIDDLRALPVILLFAAIANLVALPLENAVSRRFEARADAIALELADDPDTSVRVFRRLAFSNLADLRPPRVAVWALYTHPPATERIRQVLAPNR